VPSFGLCREQTSLTIREPKKDMSHAGLSRPRGFARAAELSEKSEDKIINTPQPHISRNGATPQRRIALRGTDRRSLSGSSKRELSRTQGETRAKRQMGRARLSFPSLHQLEEIFYGEAGLFQNMREGGSLDGAVARYCQF
jgi:hypothetical protein